MGWKGRKASLVTEAFGSVAHRTERAGEDGGFVSEELEVRCGGAMLAR